tara:strand:+ start:280 stop:483 length:204 start_codon:yes stop_codon:yes gene_type:complete
LEAPISCGYFIPLFILLINYLQIYAEKKAMTDLFMDVFLNIKVRYEACLNEIFDINKIKVNHSEIEN